MIAAVSSFATAAYIPLSLHGAVLPCRLDSGSPVSFLSRNCARKLGVPIRPASHTFISVDNTRFAADAFADVDILPPDWSTPVTIPFYIIDCPMDALLGEDALRAMGCVLDYSRGTVEFSRCVAATAPLPPVSNGEFLKMFPHLGIFKDNPDFKKLLIEFRDIFSYDSHDLGRTNVTCHDIDTGNHTSVFTPQFRRSRLENQQINQHVESMLANDIIEPSASEWGSPIFLVGKKDSSEKRLVVDFRKLNEITREDRFPMLHIDDALDHLAGCKIFSDVDATTGYWQVPLGLSNGPSAY